MSLDYHIARYESEAQKIAPSASIDMRSHEIIFGRHEITQSMFPLTYRIEDYYNDAKYKNYELISLISEIEELKDKLTKNSKIINLLNLIQIACKSAYDRKPNIWAYYD